MILRNHGTLTIGDTEFNHLPTEVVDHTVQVGAEVNASGRAAGGALLWAGLLGRLDRLDPGYAS